MGTGGLVVCLGRVLGSLSKSCAPKVKSHCSQLAPKIQTVDPSPVKLGALAPVLLRLCKNVL